MNRMHKEFVGRTYGFLRVTSITKELGIGCICTCGRYVIVSYTALADGSVTSCGCMGENAPDVQLKVLYKSAPAIFVAIQDVNLKITPSHLPDLDTVSEPDIYTLNCAKPDSPLYHVQNHRGNISFRRPHMLEKKVGALTVLSRIPKEHPKDLPQYLCLCSCGGFALLGGYTIETQNDFSKDFGPISEELPKEAEDIYAHSARYSHHGKSLLVGSDLQCICYSSRLAYVDSPLPKEPSVHAPDSFLAERIRGGKLGHYHGTNMPGLFFAHKMYLPSVLFQGKRHFMGIFSNPAYARRIQQWIRDIHLEEWMEEHAEDIRPEELKKKLQDENYAYRQKWLGSFNPSRKEDSEYLWKTLQMMNGRLYLHGNIKYTLRFKGENAIFMNGPKVIQKMSKPEALTGEGYMRPVFEQLGLPS